MQKLSLFLLTFTIIFLFSSCDKWGSVSYKATNNTSEPINIQYQNNLSDNAQDTISVSISANSTQELYIDSELIEKEFPEEGDMLDFTINVLSVTKGNVPSTTDFSERTEWIYSKIDKEEAEFNLELTNDDF